MDLTTVDHLLSTTRSVRKRLDFSRPVEREVITRCIDLALQAPTGGNSQGWSFMVVTDEAKRAAISALYKKAFKLYSSDPNMRSRYDGDSDDLRAKQLDRVLSSADYLSDNMHRAPALVIACIEGPRRKGQRAGTGRRVWLDPAGGLVVHAGLALTRARHRVDHAAHHVRTGGREHPRHSRHRHPGRAVPGRLFHR
jgi:nitroreductase